MMQLTPRWVLRVFTSFCSRRNPETFRARNRLFIPADITSPIEPISSGEFPAPKTKNRDETKKKRKSRRKYTGVKRVMTDLEMVNEQKQVQYTCF
jgi:hypothetical protein